MPLILYLLRFSLPKCEFLALFFIISSDALDMMSRYLTLLLYQYTNEKVKDYNALRHNNQKDINDKNNEQSRGFRRVEPRLNGAL